MNSSPQAAGPPVIPDHHLVRAIGEGGAGEIWLARNVIGTHRAVVSRTLASIKSIPVNKAVAYP